jgi:hypothetical protein
MMSSSRKTAIPGLAAPPVLIFFHIPKAGGMTMEKVIERCLRDEQFNAYLKMPDTALLVRSTAKVAEKVISCRSKGSMRFVAWSARILPSMSLLFFDKPSMFSTVAPSGGSGCFQLLSQSGHEPPPMLPVYQGPDARTIFG